LGNDPEDDDNDKKKKRNNYKHLIKGIPGKHSLKKDDFLATIMQVPPKQRIAIVPFDSKTQADAFAVSLEGLKKWNIAALISESPQAREDRKRRKEMKRLAKAQAMQNTSQLLQAVSTPTAPVNATTPLVTNSVSTLIPPPAITPKPAVAHLDGRPPIPVPSTKIESPQPAPLPDPLVQKGKKREHEDSMFVSPIQQQQQKPQTVTAIVGAKPGANGVRPRPLKKQRLDLQGQGREIPIQQQPTPQGV